MSQEAQHIALPKLYGAPAYARPPRPVEVAPRPFDPDELPLELYVVEPFDSDGSGGPGTPGQALAARPYPGDGGRSSGEGTSASLTPRPFRLRKLASRILGGE